MTSERRPRQGLRRLGEAPGWEHIADVLSQSIDDWEALHGPRQWRAAEVYLKFGTLRIRSGTGTSEHTRALVGFAERMSARTCMRCGAGGELRPKATPVATLCEACYASWPRDEADNDDMFRVPT